MLRHTTEVSLSAVNYYDAIPATAHAADLPTHVGALSPIRLYVVPPS